MVEERISELENRSIESIHSEENKKNQKIEQTHVEYKHTNISAMGVPEGEERRGRKIIHRKNGLKVSKYDERHLSKHPRSSRTPSRIN